MAEDPKGSLLEEAVQAWEYARAGLLEEAENIPGEKWDWRPAPESRTVKELLRHVLESGLMMVGELSREDGDFTRQGFPEHMEEHAGHLPDEMDRERLLDELRTSFAEGSATFRALGELRMLQLIRQFDGSRATRLGWMHHGVAHEEYHRGQLALYARLMGLVPALTRKIQGG